MAMRGCVPVRYGNDKVVLNTSLEVYYPQSIIQKIVLCRILIIKPAAVLVTDLSLNSHLDG